MSQSSILGGEPSAPRATGRGTDALGPSDSSDSGSDVQGERAMPTDADNLGELGALPVDTDSDSDSMGTGERGSATGGPDRDGADILPDHLVSGSEDEDALVDGEFTEDIAEIAVDDEDDGEDSGDEGKADTRDASSADSESGDDPTAEGARVFRLPAGTLEASDER